MKRLVIVAAVAAVAVASACATNDSGSLGGVPRGAPGTTATPSGSTDSPSPSTGPSDGTPSPTPTRSFTYEVWFQLDAKLFVTKRTQPFDVAVGRLSLQGLSAGPSAQEEAAGVRSKLPAGVSFQITDLTNGVATVQWGDAFYAGSSADVRFREAEATYTLTQFETISKVAFANGAGDVVAAARGRDDFDDLLPAILVESPLIGATVSSPVTVSGTANVFEATVSLRILDANGEEIARTFTTATCGTGCRGDYSVAVPYHVQSQQDGTIEVFEVSAQDGSATNVVRIPVTLTP